MRYPDMVTKMKTMPRFRRHGITFGVGNGPDGEAFASGPNDSWVGYPVLVSPTNPNYPGLTGEAHPNDYDDDSDLVPNDGHGDGMSGRVGDKSN